MAVTVSNLLDPLILDLVEWVGREPRSYGDVMDAWRTSCPRLTVWEEAVDRGLVERRQSVDGGVLVVITDEGRAMLQRHEKSSVRTSARQAGPVAACAVPSR